MNTDSFLLVDDDTAALKELAGIMNYIGFKKLQVAKSADKAWAKLKKDKIGCVISAYDMDEMSGLALLKIVRKDTKVGLTPFFLTDSAFTKVKVLRAGQAGVTGLIVSPYDTNGILTKLDAAKDVKDDPVIIEKQKSVSKAMELMENENYEEALEVFEELVTEGESAEYYYNIGFIKTSKGEYTEGIASFKKATELDQLFGKAYEAMGKAYQAIGNPEEAKKCLQTAADLYMNKEKVEDAEDILNEILQIGSESLNVFNSLGVLYRKKGDFETSLKQYRRALRINPEEPFIHYNIGRVYLDMKESQKAKEYFENAVKFDPDFEQAKQVINAIELGAI